MLNDVIQAYNELKQGHGLRKSTSAPGPDGGGEAFEITGDSTLQIAAAIENPATDMVSPCTAPLCPAVSTARCQRVLLLVTLVVAPARPLFFIPFLLTLHHNRGLRSTLTAD